MVNLFRMYEVPCFYRGELVAVCGRAKSGKTLFLSMIMAAGVAPPPEEGPAGVLALEREGEAPLRVLWIDTEQSQQSTQDIMRNRIVPMSRGQSEGMDETFYAYNLRGLGYEKRMELMALAINTVKPDLAVIDGIKDMITDINDAVQATLVMERLMALAQRNNCCIVNAYEWNLTRLFEDAFEGRSQRLINQVMGAALRLSHIADKNYYYERFNEAEQRGLIRKLSARRRAVRRGWRWFKINCRFD